MTKNITKKAVLEAAKSSSVNEALKKLFPEYFQDTLAINEGTFDYSGDFFLERFSKKAFGDSRAIQIANRSELGNIARYRSLYVFHDYTVKVRECTNGIGTTIEIHHSK